MTSTPPLQPRDAFFGGRTGAVALYHQADPGEKIFYVDVTSLYPWVNKTARYPLGHPTIYYEPEDQDLDNYFGIALVTIRPPRHLFHPVLPVRHGGKLTFPLCMQCVREEQPKPSKLMLNSFWGKFGERTNKSKVLQLKQPHELFNILTDGANDVQSLRVCTDDILEVVFKQTPENDPPNPKTNIFIAAFTTCWARLKLYSYLHRLKEQVLYYDTDSVIYAWRPGQPQIETGDYLGEMTDELDGDTIEEFVSGGAKNYGYRTVGGKYVCKVRGFTLNVRGREKLNYTSMKDHILSTLEDEEQAEAIVVRNPNHFHRNQTNKTMKLTIQDKKYRLVFDKRVIDLNSKRSYPFGYF